MLEDDPLFNAGIGSQIQSDGKIRMSAAIMDGETQKFSGVINIKNVKNPVQVAQVLFREDDRVLGGSGATSFARKNGFEHFELVGRISDSATVAGNYANQFCGVSLTGVGENIVSNATAAKIVTRVTDGFSLAEAFEKTFAELLPYDGFAGAIAIDRHGNIHHQDSHPSMVFASYDGLKMQVFG